MRELLTWPNLERSARGWLAARCTAPVYTELPEPAPEEYITVERVGGASDWVDREVDLEVAVVALSRARMWEMAQAVETAMHELAANGDPHGDPHFYVDDTAETFGFRHDPHPNQSLRRAIATYTLTVRPLRAGTVTASRP